MSRPTNPHNLDGPSPDDPDDTPTRIGGSGDAAAGRGNDEDPTVPSLQKGGGGAPPPQAPIKRPPNDPLIGKELGGCRIDGLLGRGAMGAVYRARQLRLDRDVAVKVIRPEMMTDQRTLKRFQVEARTVGRFNSAHVVMVHDVGFELGVHYLVMEFVQGKNLRDHVKLLAGGRLPAAEAIPLLRQACKGLEEAQRLGVIHRDVKPDNLMLTDRGILKIADFGIAKPVQEDFNMTLTSELIGTPLYMSPEQCQGSADLDFRSDMYSLGATFYYLLTGEPPVRASSVYELIQTKTKLENLCLWKALPDLDQNHPLSRVVERMTALDREDRYDSYEALLNDIVLVEQGGTVQSVAPKPKKTELPTLPVAPPKRGLTGLLVAAALIVVAAGGGFWWMTRGDDTSTSNSAKTNTSGGTVGPVKPDPKAVAAQLKGLQARLAQDGPSERLRDDVKAVVAEQPESRDKDLLLADVETGLGVQALLQAIRPPAAPELPFNDLREHQQRVDAAVAVDGSPSTSLRSWLDKARAAARADQSLGQQAQSRLLGAFTRWKDDRQKVAGDKTKLAELTQRLEGIEAGRRTLVDLLPGLRADLDRNLTVAAIDAARRSLADTTTSVVADVDVGEALAEIRDQFERDGPDEALSKRAGELRPTKVDQAEACASLVNELARARQCRTFAQGVRTNEYPNDPKLPFDDIAAYFEKIDRALQPLRGAGGSLPAWAANLHTNLRDEVVLQGKAVAACRSAFAAWKQESNLASGDAEKLAQRLALVVAGKARAAVLFAGAQADLDRAVPAAEIEQANAGLEQAGQRRRWLGTAASLLQRLEAVRTIADWRIVEAQLSTEIEASTAATAPFAADADVAREQKRMLDLLGRWSQAATKVKDLADKIASADLTGAEVLARAGVFGVEGREELRVLGDVAARCRDAFAALERRLDVATAVSQVTEAKAMLKPVATLVPDVDARIDGWQRAIGNLQQATSAMVPIHEGRVRGAAGQVQSFFLSPTEVSHGDYAAFLAQLRAAVNGIDTPAGRFAAVAERLGGIGLTEQGLAALLATDLRRVSPQLPIDRLTWHAAAAYAAWNGQALPRLEEWALAAFGDGNKYKYPWGAAWSSEPKDRNNDPNSLAPVDDGGLSWRLGEGLTIHHLAGNVAEWLEADPAATTAGLAGGKYNDSEPKAKDQAGGIATLADKSDGRQGFGARTVLRPRAFPGLDWPR